MAFLKGDQGVKDLAGDPVRIFNKVARQGTPRPYLIYFSLGGDDINSNSGPGSTTRKQIQIDAYADTPDEAEALAAAMNSATGGANVVAKDEDHEAFDGFIGTVAGIEVQQIDGEEIPEIEESPTAAGDNPIHRVCHQFEIVTVES